MYAQASLLRCSHCPKDWDPVQLQESEQLKRKTTMKKRFCLMSLLLLILSSQSMCVFTVLLVLNSSYFSYLEVQWMKALVERRKKSCHCDFIQLIKEFLIN